MQSVKHKFLVHFKNKTCQFSSNSENQSCDYFDLFLPHSIFGSLLPSLKGRGRLKVCLKKEAVWYND